MTFYRGAIDRDLADPKTKTKGPNNYLENALTTFLAGKTPSLNRTLAKGTPLHLAMAVSTCPFIEVPFDPPAWTPSRRDALLPTPIEIAPDGTVRPPDGPGLGVEPDLEALERFRIA